MLDSRLTDLIKQGVGVPGFDPQWIQELGGGTAARVRELGYDVPSSMQKLWDRDSGLVCASCRYEGSIKFLHDAAVQYQGHLGALRAASETAASPGGAVLGFLQAEEAYTNLGKWYSRVDVADLNRYWDFAFSKIPKEAFSLVELASGSWNKRDRFKVTGRQRCAAFVRVIPGAEYSGPTIHVSAVTDTGQVMWSDPRGFDESEAKGIESGKFPLAWPTRPEVRGGDSRLSNANRFLVPTGGSVRLIRKRRVRKAYRSLSLYVDSVDFVRAVPFYPAKMDDGRGQSGNLLVGLAQSAIAKGLLTTADLRMPSE
ncbi:hypothetical protein [Candidatus Microthrix parvicella]|uniref:hypothetical protein n=1 Tax=Candidatus Neomicrothrix parvicella TaxID=41950 RepID=UPI0012FD177D|nr:hypothetical protein [Candidatus Microthrix parvicella]